MKTIVSKRLLTVKIITIVTYVIMIVINILANTLPINNVTTSDIANKYDNLFSPAAYTFSIWIIIYVFLGIYLLYQIGLAKKLNANHRINERLVYVINKYFIISMIANILWVFAWHYDMIYLSSVAIIIFLLCLIAIAINIHKTALTKTETLMIKVPFFTLWAWLTVATIANITVTLVSWGWNGFGAVQLWTIILLLLSLTLATIIMTKYSDLAFGIVFLWAFIGILIRHFSNEGFAGQYMGVIIVTVICICILAGLVGFQCLKLVKRRAEIERIKT